MTATKSETLTVRIKPEVKAGLKTIADLEQRSVANMIEVIIRDYCSEQGIEIPDQGELFNVPLKRGQK